MSLLDNETEEIVDDRRREFEHFEREQRIGSISEHKERTREGRDSLIAFIGICATDFSFCDSHQSRVSSTKSTEELDQEHT